MTFLNPAILLALAGVAIPILIHLLYRRRARSINWGAMRFLLDSLAARRRHILLEEILLMALRCALIALVAMAAARPFLPADSRIPWVAVAPAVLAGAVCAGMGAVMWAKRWVAWILFNLAAVLLIVAGIAALTEHLVQKDRWTSGARAKDLAIVIDGSMSMSAEVDGRTNFARAVEEARAVVDSCPPGDSICVVLAGPLPFAATTGPVSDRAEIHRVLDSLRATNGAMALPEALSFAASALAQGQNPAKKIAIVTDGQSVGWDLENEARWRFLASTLAQLPAPPQVICRILPLPESCDNCAVADISLSRQVVGADRAVKIMAKVVNAGTVPSKTLVVQLTVDDRPPVTRQIRQLGPGATETVQFSHHFREPGPHLVTAQLAGLDDLPGDNAAWRVVDVLDELPVLLVEGAPSDRPLEGAASFMQIALAPGQAALGELQQDEEGPAADGGDSPARARQPAARAFIKPALVQASEISRVTDFSAYRVVVLANVRRLPDETARALKRFVREGGGLLVAPGDWAAPAFYNNWTVGETELLLPASLVEQVHTPDEPVGLLVPSCTHPALGLFADQTQSDAASAVVRAYWHLAPDDRGPAVRVGGSLGNSLPFLVERRVGKGYVLVTSVSLGRRDSNLPTLKCFVPLLHELTQYLAAPLLPEFNVTPGAQVAADVPFEPAGNPGDKDAAGAMGKRIGQVDVVTPSDLRRPASVSPGPSGWHIAFAGTREPGLYRFVIVPETDADTGEQAEERTLPFVVVREPEESFLTPLGEEDLLAAQEHIDLFRAQTTGDVIEAVAGGVPGHEIWKKLVLCAVLVLLAEMALARWITVTRRTHTAEEVQFGQDTPDHEILRSRLRSLVETPEMQGSTEARR